MSKLIIRNESGTVSDIESIDLVKRVMAKGFISSTANQRHYCHVTIFDGHDVVYATITKSGTHVFIVRNEK